MHKEQRLMHNAPLFNDANYVYHNAPLFTDANYVAPKRFVRVVWETKQPNKQNTIRSII